MKNDIVHLFAEPMTTLWHQIVQRFPGVVAALFFLLIGLFIARAVRTFLEMLLDKIRLDEAMSKVGMHELLARMGLGKSPSYAVSFIVFWSILFVFLVSAANILNLDIISQILERFLIFLPRFLVSILILFGGLLFGRFVHQVVQNSAAANNIRGGAPLAKCAYTAALVFAILMALEQLGIGSLLITSSVQILLASLGLAFALAFGLGAKGLAEEWLKDLLKKR